MIQLRLNIAETQKGSVHPNYKVRKADAVFLLQVETDNFLAPSHFHNCFAAVANMTGVVMISQLICAPTYSTLLCLTITHPL